MSVYSIIGLAAALITNPQPDPATVPVEFTPSGCTCGPDKLRDQVMALVAKNVDYAAACRQTYEPTTRGSLWLYTDAIYDYVNAVRDLRHLVERVAQ